MEDARAKQDGVAEALRRVARMPPSLDRHAALVGALIEAGELAQGLADATFAEHGMDAASPCAEAAMALLTDIARAVCRSWDGGFREAGPLPDAAFPLPPGDVTSKRAEGFAYYALYPEAYARAAAALPAGAAWRVIGLRSIGTPLGAVVAAVLRAPAWTLRPVGHPFHRALAVAPGLAAAMVADPAAHFAVVDEGPGLSGSSFGAALDFLGAQGVAEGRIHLLPGHGGAPGGQAGEAARARWDRVARHPADFEGLLLGGPERGLAAWASAQLGPAVAPLEDLSGGSWRGLRFADPQGWPAVHPFLERRKFLHRTRDGAWLLRFAGLGRHGEAAAERARRLHAGGFAPAMGGLLHGFLAERWEEESRPLDPLDCDRGALVAHLARYLGFRARHLPAGEGASAAALWSMARHNAAEAMGEAVAAGMDRWKGGLDGLEGRMRRVSTDGRMHPWEWLVLPGGRLLKADAVDHAAAHDLIGCQDTAWDVAGAAVELGWSPGERDALCAALARETGRAPDPALLAFLTPCYLAFQAGLHAMAAGAWGDGEEADRARTAAARYAEALRRILSGEAPCGWAGGTGVTRPPPGR